jgi:hypothetical protein
MTAATIHPAIQEELNMLRERFPGKVELTLDDYALYFGIGRRYACQHFGLKNRGPQKIGHKRIGKKIIIPLLDFAYWLAQQKVVNGQALVLPGQANIAESMKRRRGFCSTPKFEYRQLG